MQVASFSKRVRCLKTVLSVQSQSEINQVSLAHRATICEKAYTFGECLPFSDKYDLPFDEIRVQCLKKRKSHVPMRERSISDADKR